MRYFIFIPLVFLTGGLAFCQAPRPVDKMATRETVNLYRNLHRLLNKGIMFGHQDDLAYGTDWRYVPGKSDVKELVNDYPAVYGWELGNIEHGLPHNLDSVPFDKMRQYIREGYERGGVITISWHSDNPLTGGSAWDTTHGGVRAVLPGGEKHGLYKVWLDRAVAFLHSLKGKRGEPIPVLFRPYHELTGNWFWWCRNTCTEEEFRQLWKFTFDYLKNEKQLHHLLYMYNTSDFNNKQDFLQRYPGDDMADFVSVDIYQYGDPRTDSSFLKNLSAKMKIVEEVAAERNKIAALAETGYERIPYAQWWTRVLWEALRERRISFVLAWRNHGLQSNGNWHYYVPRKNDVSSDDFRKFYKLNRTLFEKDAAKEKLYD
jgi:mannan endo-1,4-beta-mannosidase